MQQYVAIHKTILAFTDAGHWNSFEPLVFILRFPKKGWGGFRHWPTSSHKANYLDDISRQGGGGGNHRITKMMRTTRQKKCVQAWKQHQTRDKETNRNWQENQGNIGNRYRHTPTGAPAGHPHHLWSQKAAITSSSSSSSRLYGVKSADLCLFGSLQ